MTREEAIHFANCLKKNYTIDFNDMEEFCDMVIKALEQEPVIESAYLESAYKTGYELGRSMAMIDCARDK